MRTQTQSICAQQRCTRDARPFADSPARGVSARKLLNARLFSNKETARAWDRSVTDEGGELLCVSQVRACAWEAAALLR